MNPKKQQTRSSINCPLGEGGKSRQLIACKAAQYYIDGKKRRFKHFKKQGEEKHSKRPAMNPICRHKGKDEMRGKKISLRRSKSTRCGRPP